MTSEPKSNVLPFKTRNKTKTILRKAADTEWYRLLNVNADLIVKALSEGKIVHMKPAVGHDRHGTEYRYIRIVESRL